MGSVRERDGKLIAEAVVNYKRKSKTFKTKKAAWAWIEKTENAMASGVAHGKCFADLMDEYGKRVSVHKKSHQAELRRIAHLCKDPLAKVSLADLCAADIADWRDRRLAETSAATVHREWNLLNHACNVAISDWQWLQINPMKGVTKPKTPPARNRVLSDDEVEMMLLALAYGANTRSSTVGAMMLFALETAMRAGEICKLTWDRVHERHVHVIDTKNGLPRDVPLSAKARELIQAQREATDDELVFGLSNRQLDALWRKAMKKTTIEDLHFHDTRRTALTRLSKIPGMDVMKLAKISGHSDVNLLYRVYYAPTIKDLSDLVG